ncbi:MAG TPA: universal stress protein [Gaiellaceae bacterium]|jgi:nucleotide-binding universal stress UspA family protein
MSTLTSTQNRSATAEREDRPAEPIVAAIDASAASRAAIDEAVSLAAELGAPLVFAYVRHAPAGVFGSPVYQRRLTTENERARRVLDRALHIANSAEVEAEGEILEGSPGRRIVEFARDRSAQLVVVGSRRRRFGRSVARAIARAADQSVVIAPPRSSGLALAA